MSIFGTENHNDMTTPHPYLPETEMIHLVASDYKLLQVISRFGIPPGFGTKTVEEVCVSAGVDTYTFLAIVNFVKRGYTSPEIVADVDIPTLLQYLSHSHSYFLDFFLPQIRRKLIEGINFRSGEIPVLILKLFDEYRSEVESHMQYEEERVFSYVHSLLRGAKTEEYNVSTYSHHHGEVTSKLKEVKKLILRYCPPDADANLLNAALYDIYRCGDELDSHCLVEDRIFVPAVERLEKSLTTTGDDRQR